MENEDELINLEDEPVVEKPARADNRFKDLSEKVENTAKERDAAKAEAEQAKKDAEFYKGFSLTASKYEGATEFQEKIKEKVDAGYELEDAAVSVLAKEGRLSNAPAQAPRRDSPAGGSASVGIKSPDDKPISEMTTAEKREKLLEMDREAPGSLSQTLRSTNL